MSIEKPTRSAPAALCKVEGPALSRSPEPSEGSVEGPPLLQVRGLCVTFRDPATGRLVRAVDDVSFDIPHNTFLGLTGESGSGKTSISLSLLALNKGIPGVVGGQFYYENRLIYDADRLRRLPPQDRMRRIEAAVAPLRGRDLFMIFQEPRAALNPYWKVGPQLEECVPRTPRPPSARSRSADGDAGGDAGAPRDRLGALLRTVNLPSNVLGMYPAELSTGMCQRVMIAMALALGVKLLLADEPLSRIDPRLRQKVVKVLETIRQQRKMAMLLTTHDLALLRRLADTIVMLYKGKVVEVGPTEKVLGPGPAQRHPYTQRLLEAQRLVEGVGGEPAPQVPTDRAGAFLKGLRKQVPLGHKLVEIETGHWIRM